MRIAAWLLATYLALVFQTAVAPALRIGTAAPDAAALAAMAAVLLTSSPYGFMWAGWIGLLADFVSGGPLGVSMFWFALVGYLTQRVWSQLSARGAVVQTIAALVSVTATTAGSVLTYALLDRAPLAPAEAVVHSGGVAAYTAALALPTFALFGVARRWLARRSRWAGVGEGTRS